MNKFLTKLRSLEGAIKNDNDPLKNCLQSSSPSVNWAFGIAGHGLPFGYSAVFYGPPKSGKSYIANDFVGELHRTDPEAISITFNTELRGAVQSNAGQAAIWGIDSDRHIVYDVNQPEMIFDRIETEVAALCQEGAKIKLIIIDSLKGIQGRRAMNATTVMTQQIGDEAATLQDGLKRITPVIRKYGIALIMTTHVRAELDQKEQMRGKTVKMASAWATKHLAEFFCYIEPNRSKEGRVNLAGEEFLDEETKDFMGKAEKTGHKIRFCVQESSFGTSGRTAEFTINYEQGIVNKHEEIFTLGKNLGVITKPNNITYAYGDKTWRGLVACLTAIRDDKDLAQQILRDVYNK